VRNEANQRALEASRNVMQQAETALGDAGELLQQARELVVAAGNGSYDDTNRKTLANALKGIRDQLLGVANRGDGAGAFVFGGQGTESPPFVDAAGGVAYRGSGGEATVPSGETLPLSIDGARAWLQAPNAVAGGPDLSVFDVLDRVVGELNTPNLGGAQIKQNVSDGLRDLDAVANHLLAYPSTAPTPSRIASPPASSRRRPSARTPRTSTWCRRSRSSRTSKAATMPPSRPIRWCSACRCSST
jgi:flagellar hook-associated protein 3 FlgL